MSKARSEARSKVADYLLWHSFGLSLEGSGQAPFSGIL